MSPNRWTLTHESPSREPLPSEEAISREEEAILWRSLEKIPEIYREPLILFYREHQSIERVAEELELSEDAVKQRLSRGRKLLQEQVLSFVEGALQRTSPGKAFTLGVLAGLPLLFANSAKAITVGAAIAKGSAATKTATTLASAGGLLGLLGGGYISTRAGIENTKSPRERRFRVRMSWIGIVSAIPLLALFWAGLNAARHSFALEIALAALLFCMAVASVVFFIYAHRRQRQIQIEDGTWVESEWAAEKTREERLIGLTPEAASPNTYLTAGKYLAAPLAWMMMLVAQAMWAGRWIPGLLILAASGLCFFLAVRVGQRWPRFSVPPAFGLLAPPFSILAWIACAFGMFTLLEFNLRRAFGGMGTTVSDHIPRQSAIAFNLSVVVVYVLLVGMLAWKCRTRSKLPDLQTR